MERPTVNKIVGIALAAAILLTGGVIVWRMAGRYLEKKRAAESFRTYVERSFKELEVQRADIQNQRDYIAVERRQIASRKEQLTREIRKMKELLASLGQEPEKK